MKTSEINGFLGLVSLSLPTSIYSSKFIPSSYIPHLSPSVLSVFVLSLSFRPLRPPSSTSSCYLCPSVVYVFKQSPSFRPLCILVIFILLSFPSSCHLRPSALSIFMSSPSLCQSRLCVNPVFVSSPSFRPLRPLRLLFISILVF